MNQRTVKSAFAALVVSGALAGCATSVDWGGPLLHYRYNYDSRPVAVQEPVVVPAPTSSYSAPPVVYRESTVTQYPEPAVTYRTYREPVLTYREPTVVYGYQVQLSPFTDKGE